MIATGLLLTMTLLLDGGADGAAPPVEEHDGGASDGAAAVPDAPTEDAPTKPHPLAPRTGPLTGRVVAKGGQRPVGGASLVADLADLGTTDAQGGFSADVPCGPRRLVVQAPGFEAANVTVDVCATAPAPLVLRLVPSGDCRSFQTVVNTKPTQPAIRLTGQELTQTPGSFGDPLRALESLPGVSSVSWPAPVYAVRGSNPGNTGFFLDGVRMPALFHLALGPSVIHPYFLGGLEFFPGGYPARYGRYAAGIVSAETRPAEADAIHTSVDVRLFDAGAMMSAPIAGGTVAVAGRYSYTGELISLLSKNLRLSYWDYQLRADRLVGPVQLTLLAFGSGDDLVPTNGVKVQELQLGFHRVSLRAAIPVAGGRLQGSVALGTDHSRAPVADTYPIIVHAISAAPRASYSRSFGPADLAVGFDGELSRYEPVFIGPLQNTDDWDLAKRRNAYLLAEYASLTLHDGGWLTLTPEVRYDHYEVSGAQAHDLAPRLSARIAVRDDTAIRLAGGHFTQLPSMPLQIPGADAFGLKLLGLQTSWQGSVGVETTAIPGVETTVTGYLQDYQLTDLRDPTLFSINTIASELLARRKATAYGVEVMVRRPLTNKLYGWISYTISNSLRSYGGGAVGPSDWDQRHVLNMVAGYRVGRNTLGARFHLNTGRPIVLNDGVRRLPTFYQLDLRADHAIYYDRLTLNLYAELVNATATEDVYGFQQGATPEQISETKYRIVLPSIGVRGEF